MVSAGRNGKGAGKPGGETRSFFFGPAGRFPTTKAKGQPLRAIHTTASGRESSSRECPQPGARPGRWTGKPSLAEESRRRATWMVGPFSRKERKKKRCQR